MGALLSIFMLPFIWLAGLLFPAPVPVPAEGEAVVEQADAPDFTRRPFIMPAKDSPYYEDLPWVTPWQWPVLPKLDLKQVKAAYDALPEERKTTEQIFYSLGDHLVDQDFKLIFSVWPRIAIVYDKESGTFSGLGDEGMLHLGFNYNRYDYFYPTRNPWMRNLGYTPFYDWLASALHMFNIDTVRVDFPYDGLDYRIQMWKGTYFFNTTSGCEVGIYTKPPGRTAEFYDCYPLDKMLPMGIRFYTADELYFDIPPEEHWWAVMLRARPPRLEPGAYTLEGTMDFTKDPGLGEAFLAALRAQYPEIETEQRPENVVWYRWNAAQAPAPAQEPVQAPVQELEQEPAAQEPVQEFVQELAQEPAQD